MTRTRCDRTPAWGKLQALFKSGASDFDLRNAFVTDAGRFDAFSQSAPHVFADLSKNLIDISVQQLLFDLARQAGVAEHRDAMFAGAAGPTAKAGNLVRFLEGAKRHPVGGCAACWPAVHLPV